MELIEAAAAGPSTGSMSAAIDLAAAGSSQADLEVNDGEGRLVGAEGRLERDLETGRDGAVGA